MSNDNDKSTDKRLGRMTVFRGLVGEPAIDATAAEIGELKGPDDVDSGAPTPAPNDSDTDKGAARQARTTDTGPAAATDSDKGAQNSRDPSKN